MGLAAGLLIGTKFTGILYAGPFLLVIGWSFIKKFIKSKKPAHFFKKLLCIFLPILMTAGFWYVRNWIDIGTPLYPVEIPFITHLTPMQNSKTDPLLIGTSLAANITTVDQFNEFLFYFIKRTGEQWLLIVVVLTLGTKFSIQETLTFIRQRKKTRRSFPLALPLTIGSILYFLLLYFFVFLQPAIYWKRYAPPGSCMD